MHTDRKIGFAMGILLIGIVAALFFRNEPLVDSSVPTVRRERELNQRLRERDVAVYLKDDAGESQKPDSSDAEAEPAWTLRDVLKNMDARNKSIPSPVVRSEKGLGKPRRKGESADIADGVAVIPRGHNEQQDRRMIADGSFDEETGVISDTPRTKLPPLMPVVEPLPEEKSQKAKSETPAMKDPLVESATNPVPEVKPDFQPPAEFEEYVVKYGDTLSGIAQKMLGAQSRYQEIFEANRDRIASPDKLDVGKPIRIPRTTNKSL